MTTETLLQTAVEAAQAAAQSIRELMQLPRQITEKGYLDIVTDADLAADKVIQAIIKRDWVDHTILSEEDQPDIAHWSPPEGYWWVIDPIDGTTNFAREIPSWSISIACVKGKQVQAGIVYDVVREEIYTAGLGLGAKKNGVSIYANERDQLEWAVCACDWAVNAEARQQAVKLVAALMPQVRTLRCWGTSALGIAHVAAGYLDAYFHTELKPWDLAAGLILLQEAGGVYSRLDGSEWQWNNKDILLSNRPLHMNFVRIFAAALP